MQGEERKIPKRWMVTLPKVERGTRRVCVFTLSSLWLVGDDLMVGNEDEVPWWLGGHRFCR